MFDLEKEAWWWGAALSHSLGLEWGQKVSDSEVLKIVLSYLVHNCFKETAETFIACSGMKRTADCSVDIDKRKRMLPCLLGYFKICLSIHMVLCCLLCCCGRNEGIEVCIYLFLM
jgi:hypothetical protein